MILSELLHLPAVDSEGKKVGQLGYQAGGPEAFIAKLNELKGK